MCRADSLRCTRLSTDAREILKTVALASSGVHSAIGLDHAWPILLRVLAEFHPCLTTLCH